MGSIASDEAFHAELSWAVAQWGEALLSTTARARIHERARAAVQQLAAEVSIEPHPDVRSIMGVPNSSVAGQILERMKEDLWS
jgi:hypothetical protein